MGSIEFVGIINDFFNEETEVKESIEIPENAHFIEDENWIDMSNPLNWFIIGIPIFAIILFIMAFKQRKTGIFNKKVRQDYNEKNKVTDKRKIPTTILKRLFLFVLIFMLGILIVIPIHELLHCIAGALVGLDMKFGIDPISFMAFAYTENPLTKAQFLVMSLTPLIILAIIPLIILFITYPKKEKNFKKGLIYWILTCFVGCMFMSSCPDIIQSFNFIKNIPSNAIVENDYWYIPNKLKEYDLPKEELVDLPKNNNTNLTDTINYENNKNEVDNNMENITNINVIINDKKYNAIIENNETAKSFISQLPQEFNMKELNNNEKYVYMNNTLPTNSINPKHIKSGDIMLYGNNCLVIFYKSFDTEYSYTKIGHIDNLPDLGNNSITV